MRRHLPSNEQTGENYAPIYHDTKKRVEEVFGKRDPKLWPERERTCSGCYSVLPPENETSCMQ